MAKFSFRNRKDYLQRLKSEELDVLIVGGGINGVGVLRDLCLRRHSSGPLRLGLIEKDHFGSAASSKNSQLLHGGLRYLKYFDFGLVREALRERARLLKIAPHVTWRQSFLMPVYSRGEGWYYRLGLLLYDRLAGSRSLGKSRWLSAHEALREEPGLKSDGLHGTLLFYDGRMQASRLLLDQLRESVEREALACNFVRYEKILEQEGRAMGVLARDLLTGEQLEIRARTLVFTVGAWEESTPLRLSRGSHLILPRLIKGRHALAFFEQHGRIIFVLPYGPGRDFTLVGTTEKEQVSPESVEMDAEEENYLRGQLQNVLSENADLTTFGCFSALRPLIAHDPSRPAGALSRKHKIWKTAGNVYHLGGGKWTTFRQMAEELTDRLTRDHFPQLGPCRTAELPVDGNNRPLLQDLTAKAGELAREYGVPLDSAKTLIESYGRRAPEVLELCRDPELSRPLIPGLPLIHAQIPWAIENDMIGRLDDFLTLSTPLGYIHRVTPAERERWKQYFEMTTDN
ncbi:MAG: glycerol-3-phosphate dehydrogenase/oxidase [Acidobacteriota bacterium]